MAHKSIKNKQKGAAALLLTVIILTGLLVVGLTIGLVMLTEIRLSKSSGDSVVAYYTAEAGVEMALYNIYAENPGWGGARTVGPVNIESGGVYNVTYRRNPQAGEPNIISTGTYKDSARVIVISLGW